MSLPLETYFLISVSIPFAEWDEIIKQRVIGFSWCDDCLMIPIDPYGRHGRSSTMILHKLKDDVNIDDINGETKTK